MHKLATSYGPRICPNVSAPLDSTIPLPLFEIRASARPLTKNWKIEKVYKNRFKQWTYLSPCVIILQCFSVTDFKWYSFTDACLNELLFMKPRNFIALQLFCVHCDDVEKIAFFSHCRKHVFIGTTNGNNVKKCTFWMMLKFVHACSVIQCDGQTTKNTRIWIIFLKIINLNCRNFLPLASIWVKSNCFSSTKNGSGNAFDCCSLKAFFAAFFFFFVGG